jgi:hypothetical protein
LFILWDAVAGGCTSSLLVVGGMLEVAALAALVLGHLGREVRGVRGGDDVRRKGKGGGGRPSGSFHRVEQPEDKRRGEGWGVGGW